ncbi:MAG TPA: hypothetical protein PK674_01970 [Candidatus Absconditabacterales bacterium]|nr:hypothetical protein [Candidatus Absconditabacterales bacterium]
MFKKIFSYIISLTLFVTTSFSFTSAYLFGIKSFDNTIDNIQKIESKHKFNFPIVAFIFDPRDEGQMLDILNNLSDKFGANKIYHITLSPNNYSAKQVADGKFDNQYTIFFQLIKRNNLKVIFRTMHEMNGGWYPRGSNPDTFKEARIHVRNLSRKLGLDQNNILFDMSVNHRDMPTKSTPSQTAFLITCDQKSKFTEIKHQIFVSTGRKTEIIEKKVPIAQSQLDKLLNRPIKYNIIKDTVQIEYPIYKVETEKQQNCYTFEDYYPGNKYVDILGVTFYNRGKASYNRHRLLPEQILNDKDWDTLKRLKSFKKPIFIDEVATTAVRYPGAYNQELSRQSYRNDYDLKNQRLVSLKDFMLKTPEILGMIYFNIDYTYGLTHWMIGEADRAIINLNSNKFYSATCDLYNHQSNNKKLLNLFNSKKDLDPSVDQNARLLADLLIEKFGVEESIKRIEIISLKSKSVALNNLLGDVLHLLKIAGKGQK